MQYFEAPQQISNPAEDPVVFLAGSIEQGTAERWQQQVVAKLAALDVVVLNPRRAEWDPLLQQSMHEPKFVEQVTWELAALEQANYVLMYFDPNTRSPISLLELGLFKKKCLVVCPDGFWRKGNVDIVCERYGVLQLATLDQAVDSLIRIITKY